MTTQLHELSNELQTGPLVLAACDMRTETTIDALASLLESIDPDAYASYLDRDPIIRATIDVARDELADSTYDLAGRLVERVRSFGAARSDYNESNAYDDLHFTVDDLSSLLDDRLSDIDAYVQRDPDDPSYLVVTTVQLEAIRGDVDDFDVEPVVYDETGEPSLSEPLALAFLERDGGRVPCSRYGSHSSDLAPTVLAATRAHLHETGEPMTFAMLDYVMSLAVNDSPDVAHAILTADPDVRLNVRDVLDVDVIGRFVLDELTSKLSPGPWPHPNEPTTVDLGSFDTGDPYGSVMQLAFAVNECAYLVGEPTDETFRPSPLLSRMSLQSDDYELTRELVESYDAGELGSDELASAIDALSDAIDACKRWGVDY